MTTNRLLVIDGNNSFIRHYSVNTEMNADGVPLGGTSGFVKELLKLVKNFKPNMAIVVWDGERGSIKKRAIYPAYKEGRKVRLGGRNFEFADEKSAKENLQFQIRKLKEILDSLPVLQIEIPDCEADDVIAYIIQNKNYFGFTTSIICSCDRDFYQLIDNKKNDFIFNSMTKELIDEKYVLDKFDIHPQNWLFYRSIDGDKSDNLNGVPKYGIKTIQKLYPLEQVDIDFSPSLIKKTWETVSNMERKLIKEEKKYFPKYEKLYNHLDIIERNWKLMDLKELQISSNQTSIITDNIGNFKPTLNSKGLFKTIKELNGISLLDGFYVDFITLVRNN